MMPKTREEAEALVEAFVHDERTLNPATMSEHRHNLSLLALARLGIDAAFPTRSLHFATERSAASDMRDVQVVHEPANA